MSIQKTLQTLGFVVVAFVLLIQLVPYGRAHQNPTIQQEPQWNSESTEQLIRQACYDCHSNETVWPWYSNVAPASWLVQQHVDEGRYKLNFSEWQQLQANTLLLIDNDDDGYESDDDDDGYEDDDDGGHGNGHAHGEGREHDAEEIIEAIQDGTMPPRDYLLLHPEARLSEAEKQQLIAGIRATLGTQQAASR